MELSANVPYAGDVRRMASRSGGESASSMKGSLPLPADQGTGLGKPLKLINQPARSSIPIFLAALGMRNVALTARLADGWMPALYIPEMAGQIWGAPLAEGGKARAAELGPLQVVAGGPMAIGDDVTELGQRLRASDVKKRSSIRRRR